MLTVDTHHIGGYRCKYCKSEYPDNYSNVISCADRQLVDFIDWIKSQDFYENTTIVISGDHPSMDSGYILSYVGSDYLRRIYNCFINPRVEAVTQKNREFVTMDMFPTILAAMGCDIEGERLGLGTNLFSDKKTFAEELGYIKLQEELSKSSSYYNNNFLNGLK
jgi:phosphoglycerol transferase